MCSSNSHRALGCLLALCACNQIFRLQDTKEIDAKFYDASIDAPFTCPAFGTPPKFSRDFQQLVIQKCSDFTVSLTAQRVLAACEPGPIIGEADLGASMLVPAPGLAPGSGTTYYTPRLGADGDVAVVVVYTSSPTTTTTLTLFRRAGTAWTMSGAIPFAFATIGGSSGPTHGPNMRLLVSASTDNSIHELVESAGSWADVATYTPAQLGVTGTNDLNLSGDGLRFTFETTGKNGPTFMYADRRAVTDRFSLPIPLPSLPFLENGFIDEDCGRLYFSALGSVFYAPRLQPD